MNDKDAGWTSPANTPTMLAMYIITLESARPIRSTLSDYGSYRSFGHRMRKSSTRIDGLRIDITIQGIALIDCLPYAGGGDANQHQGRLPEPESLENPCAADGADGHWKR